MKTTAYYIIIFYALVAQGSHTAAPLVILNIYFIIDLLLRKVKLTVNTTSFLFFALFTAAFIATFFSLSINSAITELLKYSLFAISYLHFSNTREYHSTIDTVFHRTFILLMIFGFLGVTGILPNMVQEYDGRLHSLFGYANTTALVLGIGIFYSVEKCRQNGKWKTQPFLINAFLALAFFTAMFLTHSRTTFVVFVLVFGFYVLQKLSGKVKLAILCGGISSFILLSFFDIRVMQISLFAPTLVERYISYLDALNILLRRPLGIGLGNWQYLQFYYQSAPYHVTYIHNHYLQLALDGGLLAAAGFTAILVLFFTKIKRDVYFYVGIFIAVTAIFEVHFNFGFVIIYFAYLLARNTSSPEISLQMHRIKYVLLLPLVFLCILLTSNFFISRGQDYLWQGDLHRAYNSFNIALRLNPLNDGLNIYLAQTQPTFEGALIYLAQGHRANHRNIPILDALAWGHIHAGNFEEAYYYANKLLETRPLSEHSQRMVADVLMIAYNQSIISGEEYEQFITKLEQRIYEINTDINSLYRFIDSYMRY